MNFKEPDESIQGGYYSELFWPALRSYWEQASVKTTGKGRYIQCACEYGRSIFWQTPWRSHFCSVSFCPISLSQIMIFFFPRRFRENRSEYNVIGGLTDYFEMDKYVITRVCWQLKCEEKRCLNIESDVSQ